MRKKDIDKQRMLARTILPSQPYLMVIAVAAILVCLIIFLGLSSVGRTEKALLRFLEDNCEASAEILERIVEENLNVMQESARETQKKFLPLGGEVFSPEKLLVTTIGEKAKELDRLISQKQVDVDAVNAYAKDNNLLLVMLLDSENKVVFQSAPVPKKLFSAAKMPYRQEASFETLEELAKKKALSFIALQRQDKSGTIIVVLDSPGLRYWGMVVAVGKAVRDLRHGQNLEYVRVFDEEGRLLAFAGALGNHSAPAEEENIRKILKNNPAAIAQQFDIGQERIVGKMFPLKIKGKWAGVISIGIDWGGAQRILVDNQRNVLLSIFIAIVIAVAALIVLHRNQKIHIAKELEIEKQLEKAERLSSLGKLAAGVAHEIRNPLNAISMATQRIQRDFIPVEEGKRNDFANVTAVVRDEIRRLDGIIEEFLAFSRIRRLEIHPCALSEIISKLVYLVTEQARDKGVEIHTEMDESLIVPLDAAKLRQALLNIIKNALESISEPEGKITIRAHGIGGMARIVVSDTGCGMNAQEIEQIFNPEYTTKEKGLGLGLTLAHEIIKGHGGSIAIASKQNEGTRFEVFLPLKQDEGEG